jgi:ATP-dependent DNA helicase RecQ
MKQRVISGVIIAVLIIALGLLGGTFLAIPIMLCSMIGYAELGRAVGFLQKEQKVNLMTGLALGITVVYYVGLIILETRWGSDPRTMVYASDFFTMVILIAAFLALMIAYCKTKECLRGYILEYFGQKHAQACGNCGNCKGEFETADITREAQMVLSCVKRIYDKLGYYVGAAMVAKVLQGSREKQILELDLQELSTYGLMKTTGRTEIRAMADYLESLGYLLTEPEHQTLRLTPEAAQVLYHGQTVQMLVRREEEVPARAAGDTKLTAEEMDLYDALRQLRGELARDANVPAYVVFSNATLADMARKQPKNMSQFKKVSGVGEIKAAWYGEAFLKCIREYEKENES